MLRKNFYTDGKLFSEYDAVLYRKWIKDGLRNIGWVFGIQILTLNTRGLIFCFCCYKYAEARGIKKTISAFG